jgi:hypothetical protein
MVEEDLASVIKSCAARSASNPAQAYKESVGSYEVVPSRFDGFNLVELSVLRAYRRMAA